MNNNLIYIPFLFLLTMCGTESTPTFTIQTSSVPSEGGSVEHTPSATVQDEGTEVSFTAVPNEGYLFTQWQGDLSGTSNPSSITLSKDINVTAAFEKKTYPLSVGVTGEGTVAEKVIQAKTDYEHGTIVELTPTPSTGWTFVEWTGDINSNEPVQEITVTEPTTVTAVFEKKIYPLTVNLVGEGEVMESIVSTKTDYEYSTNVRLTAIPDTGWAFVSWSGDVVGTDSITTVSITDSTNVTATFEKESFPLNITVEGGGVVEENLIQSKSYEFGSIVQLVAKPEYGWEFDSWSGDVSGEDSTVTVEVDGPKNVRAIFKRQSFELDIRVEGDGEVDQEIVQSKSYEYQTLVKLTANPSDGWGWSGWSGDTTSSEREIVVNIDQNKSFTASFAEIDYTITKAVEGEGAITLEPELETYKFGTSVRATATPADGWEFQEWLEYSGLGNPSAVTGNRIQFEVQNNVSLSAKFKQVFKLTTSVTGSGSISPASGTFNVSEVISLTATPDDGYDFDTWSGDASGSDNPLSVIMDSNKDIVANFSPKVYSIETSSTTNGVINFSQQTGQELDSGFPYGSEVSFEAVPNNAYFLDEWSGSLSGNENPTTLTITSDVNVDANFSQMRNGLRMAREGGFVQIGSLLYQASFRFYNETDQTITVNSLNVYNDSGNLTASLDDIDTELEPSSGLGYSLSFNFNRPTSAEYDNYSVAVNFTYRGSNYTVRRTIQNEYVSGKIRTSGENNGDVEIGDFIED